MIAQTIVDDAYEYIRRQKHVTFVELGRFLERQGIEHKGDKEITYGHEQVVLWTGMSDAFVDLTKALRPRTDITPTSFLVYLIDGSWPRYPLAKRIPKSGYKKPHWCPVTFNVKELEQSK